MSKQHMSDLEPLSENRVSLLVLLYNKQISDSATLNTLLQSQQDLNGCHLVIWNNGPHALDVTDTSEFCSLGLTVDIVESLDNRSLAVLYNQFIAAHPAQKYVVLDDDSILNDGYIEDVLNATAAEFCLPSIYMNSEVKGPRINKKMIAKPTRFDNHARISAIGSGTVLGSEVVTALNNEFGTVFDERFFFYGVDTSLFLRLNQVTQAIPLQVIRGFNHSLSRYEEEAEHVKRFRLRERSCQSALCLRYYKNNLSGFFCYLRNVVSHFGKRLSGKEPKIDLREYSLTYYTGKHYRAR